MSERAILALIAGVTFGCVLGLYAQMNSLIDEVRNCGYEVIERGEA